MQGPLYIFRSCRRRCFFLFGAKVYAVFFFAVNAIGIIACNLFYSSLPTFLYHTTHSSDI